MNFSLIEAGLAAPPNVTRNINIYELIERIKENPRSSEIQQLQCLERHSEPFEAIKRRLPVIKPHGIFEGYGDKAHFQFFSGYLYFDIDSQDVDEVKAYILKVHANKICLLGKSVSGKGLFFYVKLEHPCLLTQDNYHTVHSYFLQTVFSDLQLDVNATGLSRNQIIPYDTDLYVNLSITVLIPEHILDGKSALMSNKGGGRCYHDKKPSGFKFEPIQECHKHIVKETIYDTNGEDYIIGLRDSARLYIPEVIRDGTKHKTYRAMVNAIVFNNRVIDFKYVVSYINYINATRTGSHPMKTKELYNTVKREYDRLKGGGKFFVGSKCVFTNPNLSKEDRRKASYAGRSEYRIQRSLEILKVGIKHFADCNEIPSQTQVSRFLGDKLSLSAVKKHWKRAMEEVAAHEGLPIP
ncbi:MAG: hypothetical protein EOO06_09350 [Chitinophagaceae bacterium]|nr:MAG: hypothetical protein EOO06_09350 [Chitinophagaceae bacterium]